MNDREWLEKHPVVLKEGFEDLSMNYEHDGVFERIVREMAKAEEERRFNEWKSDGTLTKAVLVCNRENKFKLKCAMPELCIVGHDLCGDDEVFMITDKDMAENARRSLGEENYHETRNN